MTPPVVAVLGGTGAEGSGLAARWVRAGYRVVVGSRDAARAAERAAAVGAEGMENLAAAEACGIAVLTVPFEAQRATLERVRPALQGKTLVDATVPLRRGRAMRVALPPEGSAARAAQEALGDGVRVVSAFQNVSAELLRDPDGPVDCDVLVSGDDPGARAEAVRLAEAAGMRAVEAGPLDNAAAAEALTSLLLWMNRRYGVRGAGIRVTGIGGG